MGSLDRVADFVAVWAGRVLGTIVGLAMALALFLWMFGAFR